MTSNSIGRLDSSFTSLINDLMTIERQPLTRLTQGRDNLKVKKAMYSDMKKMFEEFESLVESLNSKKASYSFLPGRSVKVTSDSADKTVLSVIAGQSAVAGAYRVEVTTLATGQKVRSDQQIYANQALGFSGSFLLGGDVQRSQTTQSTTAGTVTGFDVAAPAQGQLELGAADYFVETRKDTSGQWQFRLVDAEGTAVNIQNTAASGTFTTGWQAIPTNGGEVNTGRGLKFTLGSDPAQYQAANKATGAARVSYRPEGASISVDRSDSLIDIAYAINHARYAEGNEVTATIIDRQLILSTKNTGAGQSIRALDVSGSILSGLGVLQGGAYKNSMQAAANAVFKLNDLPVTRSRNTGLTDVVQGLTLNLAGDAQSQKATLTVEESITDDKAKVSDFLTRFNKMTKYLGEKLAVTKNSDGTYKRGALAGESIFSSLRMNLLRTAYSPVANSGTLRGLSDLGITLNDSMELVTSSASKLETALTNNRDSVVALFDGLMEKLETQVTRFNGAKGYMTMADQTLDKELKTAEQQITTFNARLAAREADLTEQFAQAQAQILSNQYLYQQLGTIYSVAASANS